jgi:hypothetical protein
LKFGTHILIAKKVYELLKNHYGIKLNKHSFIIGNIFPDIVRRFGSMHHTMGDSLEYVLRRINKLKAMGGTLFSSFHIGKTNHYLSDFFCSVHHRSHIKVKFKDHLKYEDALHEKFLKMEENSKLDSVKINLKHMPLGDFRDIILDLDSEYMKNPSSMENDILFGIWAPLTACKYLLSSPALDLGEAIEQAA